MLLTAGMDKDSMAGEHVQDDEDLQDHEDLDGRPAASKRRWGWLALAVVLVAGCSTVPSNTPPDYDEITQDNYLSACEESGEQRSDCQCFYDEIVDTVPFNDFKDFESRVKEDPTDVPGRYQDIVTQCVNPNPTVLPRSDTSTEPGDSTTTTSPPS